MSRRQVQLNLYWEDDTSEGISYIDGFEKRNFKLDSETEFDDLYIQLKTLIVDFFTPELEPPEDPPVP